MTEEKRDLQADLAICEEATEGPWALTFDLRLIPNKPTMPGKSLLKLYSNQIFVVTARTGWPHAIRRAMEAEACVVELISDNAMLHAKNDVLTKNVHKERDFVWDNFYKKAKYNAPLDPNNLITIANTFKSERITAETTMAAMLAVVQAAIEFRAECHRVGESLAGQAAKRKTVVVTTDDQDKLSALGQALDAALSAYQGGVTNA